MSSETSSAQLIAALKTYELDNLAVETARPIAAAFEAAGWTYEECTPDAAHLAVRTLRKLEDVQMDHQLSSGRVSVSRYIDDSEEVAEVWLHVGTARAEKADVKGNP